MMNVYNDENSTVREFIENQEMQNEDHNENVNELSEDNFIERFQSSLQEIFNQHNIISPNINIQIDSLPIIQNNSEDNTMIFNIPIGIYANIPNYEDVVVCLTEEEFNNLETKEINQDNEEIYKECYICMESFHHSDIFIELPCKHYYHKNCIHKWLCESSKKCPVCREEVSNGSPKL